MNVRGIGFLIHVANVKQISMKIHKFIKTSNEKDEKEKKGKMGNVKRKSDMP